MCSAVAAARRFEKRLVDRSQKSGLMLYRGGSRMLRLDSQFISTNMRSYLNFWQLRIVLLEKNTHNEIHRKPLTCASFRLKLRLRYLLTHRYGMEFQTTSEKILFKTQVLCLKRAHVYMQMRMTDLCCKLPQEGVLSNFSSRFTCVVQWRICIDWVKLGSLGLSRQYFLLKVSQKLFF